MAVILKIERIVNMIPAAREEGEVMKKYEKVPVLNAKSALRFAHAVVTLAVLVSPLLPAAAHADYWDGTGPWYDPTDPASCATITLNEDKTFVRHTFTKEGNYSFYLTKPTPVQYLLVGGGGGGGYANGGGGGEVVEPLPLGFPRLLQPGRYHVKVGLGGVAAGGRYNPGHTATDSSITNDAGDVIAIARHGGLGSSTMGEDAGNSGSFAPFPSAFPGKGGPSQFIQEQNNEWRVGGGGGGALRSFDLINIDLNGPYLVDSIFDYPTYSPFRAAGYAAVLGSHWVWIVSTKVGAMGYGHRGGPATLPDAYPGQGGEGQHALLTGKDYGGGGGGAVMFPLWRDDGYDFAGGADGGIGGGGNAGEAGETNTGGGGGGGGREPGGDGIVIVQYAYTQPQPLVSTGSVTITGPAEVPDCGEASTFTAFTSGIARPSYQWRKNFVDVPGATASSYTADAVYNGDYIECIVTPVDDEPCDGSQVVSVASNRLRPEYGIQVSITNDLPFSSANVICSGTVIPFSAHVVNAGTSPQYQWRRNGSNIPGATGPTLSSGSLRDNDVIDCMITTTDARCGALSGVQSNRLTVRIVGTFFDITTQADDAGYCAAASSVVNYTYTDRLQRSCVRDDPPHVFTAQLSDASGSFENPVAIGSVTGTGAGPGQINVTIPASTPEGAGYRVRVVGVGVVGSDNGKDIPVTSADVPAVNLTADGGGTFCDGDMGSFYVYASAMNRSATFQWLRNDIPINEPSSQERLFDTRVAAGDVISCEVATTSNVCGRSVVKATVKQPVLPKVSAAVHISSSAGPICKGAPVTFTATPVNAGAEPTYQWTLDGNDIGTTHGPSFTTTLPTGISRVGVAMHPNARCLIPPEYVSDMTDFDVPADTIKPTISGMPGDVTIHKPQAGAVSWVEPTSSDNCRIVSFTSDHHSGDVFPVGTTTVTYTATDFENNVQTRSFAVTVDSSPVCGDGTAWGAEACDDGNTAGGDCCSPDCQYESSDTVCRALAGVCDVAETCTGTSATCPADAKSAAVCRPADGVCDIGETCDGSSNSCPDDVLVYAICRTTSGACDLAEFCTGTSADCPANLVQQSGKPCGDASVSQCSGRDICDGTVACNPNDSAAGTACDDGDACTVNDSCAGGACVAEPVDCDDADPCTQDSCDPSAGTCSSVMEPAVGCRTATGGGLQFKTTGGGSGAWKWKRGQATACGDLGSPDIDSDYDVCVYDGTGANVYELATSFHLPANASWTTQGDCQWSYLDDAAASDGITSLETSPGADGRASVVLGFQGANIPLPTPVAGNRLLNMNPAVTVQMFNGSGICWESQFTDAYRNSATNFKTKMKFSRPR